MTTAGRSYWAALHIVDRQIDDCDDRAVAKVDDLEIAEANPDEPGSLPIVTAMLCGPAALGQRLGPRIGAFLEALRGLSHEAPTRPAAIAMDDVKDIGTALKLWVPRDTLPVTAVEDFVGDHVIGHIPGSGASDDASRDAP